MNSSSSRSVGILAAIAVLASIAVWKLTSSDTSTQAGDVGAAERAAPAPPTPAGDAAEDLADLANLSADSETRVARVAPSEVAEGAAPEPTVATELRVLVAGSVQLTDQDGVIRSDVSGELELTVWNETSGHSLQTSVKDGAFEAMLRISDSGAATSADGTRSFRGSFENFRATFDECRLDGYGPVLLVDEAEYETATRMAEFPPGTTGIKLDLAVAPSLTLNVLDAATGNHLDGVKVVECSGASQERVLHPFRMGASTLVEDAASPTVVPPSNDDAGDKRVGLLISAPGYAWKGMTADFSRAGERTIELTPGGDLLVTLVGDAPKKSELRIFAEKGGVPLTEIRLGTTKTVTLDGIAPGTYEVHVELGPWYQEPMVLGEASINVRAGEEAGVTIEIQETAPVIQVEIGGTLYVPPAWNETSPGLKLHRLSASKSGASPYMHVRPGEIKAVPETPGEYRFSKPDIETGRYVLSYSAFEFKLVFDVPPEGRNDLRMEIPEPVEISVSTIDGSSGEENTDIKRLTWHPKWSSESGGGSLASEMRDPSTNRFHFRVPRCPVQVAVRAGHQYGRVDIESPTHGLEVTLEIQTRPSTTVELRSGEQTIPWHGDFPGKVEAIDGDGMYNSSGTAGGQRWFGVSEPGRYRLTIPEIDGFLAHEPIEIELLGTELQELIIELTPR